jgi:hypothetical protein
MIHHIIDGTNPAVPAGTHTCLNDLWQNDQAVSLPGAMRPANNGGEY